MHGSPGRALLYLAFALRDGTGPASRNRLPLEEMAYTTRPAVAKKTATPWQPLE